VDEQLNLDQNVTFKTFQCSIQSLEDATDIDFSGIKGFDTFKGTSPAKEVSTTKALGDHIAAQNQ
jgi:endonuclease G